MLYELYIEGQKADLTEDIEICLSYTALDTEKPEAQHGGYSKSVDLPGSENNNSIFGQLYNLDRSILFDENKTIGVYFDPSKRCDYVLWYNGDVVDRGYIKVDNVTNEDGDITYSLTLFSDLGDFFYNLMYNKETGEEKTLADLHYGFIDDDDNPIDEDNEPLMEWNKDYIYNSWSVLGNLGGEDAKYVENCITAAPTYSGYYNNDFDSDKVLVNYESLPNGGVSKEILLPAINADNTYEPYKGWILASATRDLDEFEMRDLRSQYQRPAIKLSVVLDAISSPENNGGFEVVWDPEIKNSAYYQNTYLIFNKIDYDKDEHYADAIYLNAVIDNMPCLNGAGFYTTKFYDVDQGQSATTFNLSNATNPKIKISHNATVHYEAVGNVSNMLITSYYYFGRYFYGGQAVRLTAWKNGQMVAHSNTYLQTTNTYGISGGFGYKIDDWRQKFANKLGLDSGDEIVLFENFLEKQQEHFYRWQKQLQIEMDLPNEDGIEIQLESCWVWIRSLTGVEPAIAMVRYDEAYIHANSYEATSNETFRNDDNEQTGIFDDEKNEAGLKTKLYKKILFAETESPYKYLIGFTRAIGAKYRYDLSTKKIYINKRENYYLPVGYKIDGFIDRKQPIEIQPTLTEYKWYKYQFETPETYATKLYDRKNTYGYGEVKVDTNYYFSNETHDCFEGIPYQNAIPYLQNSLYYAMYDGVSPVLNSPTLDVSTFKLSGTTIVDKTTKIYGYCAIHEILKISDNTGDKLCMFGDDNDEVDDFKNCLAFFNGYATSADWYQISDNIRMMESLNENQCFMYVSANTEVYESKDAVSKQYVCKWTKQIPIFSKYLTGENGAYTDSLDFVQPNYTFIGNDENYQAGICLFDRYWRNYLEDLYDPDGKAVTVKMFLREQPDLAMRKFYLFDNSIWVISEITDYDVSSREPTQVKFVMVRDYHNYVDSDLVWNGKYDKIE